MTTPGKAPVESVRVAEDHQRAAWVPWAIGLLLLLLLAALLFFFLGDDDDDADVDVAEPSVSQEVDPDVDTAPETAEEEPIEPADTAPEPVVIDVGDVPAGTAVAADIDVFADEVTPPDLIGDTITANEVLVQELVADEAFYVGPEQGNTILVRLSDFAGPDQPESPFEVTEGGRVSFTGLVQEIDDALVADLRLYDPAEELELGDYYIQIDQISSVG